ncbi:PA3496 family putative envelope integrity protein [Pseudoteredinibacter isoporae]|uniref:Uncharacterized protein n=1 Tax=Pseudoteredinibacter isoporae TaxID=570281 RepID=A0A7X0JYA7_9GAMM|nr:hypothetical protein [Pseudoteredinibacter isoporae]MBB6523476.1 hypothetical protein [Pseudoteredinibacter isoporae]NHO88985.1 hypothetical protein [Pseudoteredinibacter isoporae]NIB24307.1 hypothetical protein [Pseudoteredinibacter isoporae]
MSYQVLEEQHDFDPQLESVICPTVEILDARRRLEDRLEEARLRRETQEFPFDFE